MDLGLGEVAGHEGVQVFLAQPEVHPLQAVLDLLKMPPSLLNPALQQHSRNHGSPEPGPQAHIPLPDNLLAPTNLPDLHQLLIPQQPRLLLHQLVTVKVQLLRELGLLVHEGLLQGGVPRGEQFVTGSLLCQPECEHLEGLFLEVDLGFYGLQVADAAVPELEVDTLLLPDQYHLLLLLG